MKVGGGGCLLQIRHRVIPVGAVLGGVEREGERSAGDRQHRRRMAADFELLGVARQALPELIGLHSHAGQRSMEIHLGAVLIAKPGRRVLAPPFRHLAFLYEHAESEVGEDLLSYGEVRRGYEQVAVVIRARYLGR
jgi:hypothetical protein